MAQGPYSLCQVPNMFQQKTEGHNNFNNRHNPSQSIHLEHSLLAWYFQDNTPPTEELPHAFRQH